LGINVDINEISISIDITDNGYIGGVSSVILS